MVTRNLTAVVVDGKYKLAQYGHFDGYPRGQGVRVLTFCHKNLASDEGRGAFREQLKLVRFVGRGEYRTLVRSIGVLDDVDWMTGDQSKRFEAKWPYFSNEHGARILGLISQAIAPVLVLDSISFVRHENCQWVYVIDLDDLTLEVYRGLPRRFAKYATVGKNYKVYDWELLGPIESWPLNALPAEVEFLKALGEDDK